MDKQFLTRIDSTHFQGWRVYIARGEFRRVRYFGDSRYFGADGALAVATLYRNQQRRQMPALAKQVYARSPGRVFREIRTWRDSSGALHCYDAWVAWIKMGAGRIASTSYSVEKWGERQAKALAVAYLERKRAERAEYERTHDI